MIQTDRNEKLKSDSFFDGIIDAESPNFWTHGNIELVKSLLDCKNSRCPERERHLLSPNRCPEFMKQMYKVDLLFADLISKKTSIL